MSSHDMNFAGRNEYKLSWSSKDVSISVKKGRGMVPPMNVEGKDEWKRLKITLYPKMSERPFWLMNFGRLQ